MIIDDVIEINRRLFYNLWHIAGVSPKSTGPTRKPTGLSPRLVLPMIRPKEKGGDKEDVRVSEQEARFLYCGLLNNLNYFYSVETPTSLAYSFTDTEKTGRSASSDLSLYTYDSAKSKFNKVMNVELKAHNAPMEHVEKDIKKLVWEKPPGNWFHLFKNVNKRTLPTLFEKIADSLKACSNSPECRDEISIIFSFCVLDQKWGCIRHFGYKSSDGDVSKFINRFFDGPKYEIKNKRIDVSEKGGWQIIEERSS